MNDQLDCKDKNLICEMLKIIAEKNLCTKTEDGRITEKFELIAHNDFTIKDCLESNESFTPHGDGATKIHYFCSSEKITPELLNLMKDEDFYIKDNCGYTPLHWLCNNKMLNYKMLRIIFDRNLNLLIESHNKSPALHTLCQNIRLTTGIAELILKKYSKNNYEVLYSVDEDDVTALECIFENETFNAEILRVLKNNKINLNKTENNGCSLIHIICSRLMTPEILNLIINEDLYSASDNGDTPLHNLLDNGSLTPELLQMLIDTGIDLSRAGDFMSTPIHVLCTTGKATVENLRVLPEKYLYLTDSDGNTPLHNIFVRNPKSVGMINLMKEKNLFMKNCNKITPFYYIQNNFYNKSNPKILELMRYIVFPFKLNPRAVSNLIPELKQFRDEQKYVHQNNYKYLENEVKHLVFTLLLIKKRISFLTKDIIFCIITNIFY